MTIDQNNPKHVIAEDGMVLYRLSNGDIYGTEIALGLIPNTVVEDVVENFGEMTPPSEDEETENEPNGEEDVNEEPEVEENEPEVNE